MRNMFAGVLIAAVLVAGSLAAVALVPLVETRAYDASGCDTSRRPSSIEREWKDEHGTVIKRLDSSGRLTLYWWDSSHRLVKVAGMAHLYTPAQVDGPLEGEAWVHCFTRNEEGRLTGETDCIANEHEIDPGQLQKSLDMRSGTSLAGHRHVEEAGCRGRLVPRKTTTFHYNERGGIEKVTEK
jgi:hypothetical protein